MNKRFLLFPLSGLLSGLLAAAGCGDHNEPVPDAAPEPVPEPKPPSKLVCPSESGSVAFSRGILLGATSTHVLYLEAASGDILAWPGQGDAKKIAASQGRGWGHPVVTERALFTQLSQRSFVVTEMLLATEMTGAERTITLPVGRETWGLKATGEDSVLFRTTRDVNYPASDKPHIIERYRLGADAPEPLIIIDEDDEGQRIGMFDVEGDVLVWAHSFGEETHVKKRILSTGEETELFTKAGIIYSLQIEGPWLFLEELGPVGSALKQYSLADGSLQVSYPQPGYAPPIKHLALVGDRLFGVGNRGVEIGTGCPLPSALYELTATGAMGTLTVRQSSGDRLVLSKDGFGFFNLVSGGVCGGHGNTVGPPMTSSVGCFLP